MSLKWSHMWHLACNLIQMSDYKIDVQDFFYSFKVNGDVIFARDGNLLKCEWTIALQN